MSADVNAAPPVSLASVTARTAGTGTTTAVLQPAADLLPVVLP